MTSVLKNSLTWTRTWLGQILSALAWLQVMLLSWLQVMLLSGYQKTVAMRAIHKGMHRAYETSPHAVRATVKCAHSLVHHMPTKHCIVLTKVKTWLKKHAIWNGIAYTSWMLPLELSVDGINGTWNEDIACIEPLQNATCNDTDCQCRG